MGMRSHFRAVCDLDIWCFVTKISPSWRRFPVGVDHLKGDRRLREIDFSFGDRRQIDISSTSTSSFTFSWRKQTAGPTVLHDQLWTAFLWVFWSDCLERHAGSTAQLGLISKWLQTIAENRFVPDCSGVVTPAPLWKSNLLTERFEMPVYYYYYYYYQHTGV